MNQEKVGSKILMGNLTGSAYSSFEFDKLLTKNKISENKWEFGLKKEALNDVDRFVWYLPKSREAIKIITNLAINKGLTYKDEENEEQVRAKLESFNKYINGDVNDFFGDIVRLLATKSNLCLVLNENNKKQRYWEIVAPHRYKLIASSENVINAKYNIKGVKIKVANNWVEYDLEKDKNIIIVKSSPSNIFGIPSLLFNEATYNTIVAEIERQFLIANSGAFNKSILGPKKESNIDAVTLMNDLNDTMHDPNKSVYATNQEIEVHKINVVEGQQDFWQKYNTEFVSITAAAFGLAPSMLLNPKDINRSTQEENYKETIQYTIKPLNEKLNKLVQRMVEIMNGTNTTANIEQKNLIMDKPKEFLDIQVSASDLKDLEKEGVIKTNQLLKLIGLPELDESELAEREKHRGISNQLAQQNNNKIKR